jgi:hypothetical protein
MVIDRHNLSRRGEPCSWLGLLIAATVMVFLTSGILCASEGPPNPSTPGTDYLRGLSPTSGDRCLAASDLGPPFLFGQPEATSASGGVAAEVPGTDQSPRPSDSASPDAADQKRRTDVNPITGLAVSEGSNYTPLNLNERWKLYLKMNFASAGPYFSPVVNALALDQANDTPRQWGGGFPGFGRRLASRTANALLQGSFQAPLAAMLHEDVRYIATSERSVPRRALHAVLYSFLTYNDKGHPTLNIANLASFYASTAVTAAWLPGIGNAARYTFTNASEQIALNFPLNVAQEFWPEIRHHILRRQ